VEQEWECFYFDMAIQQMTQESEAIIRATIDRPSMAKPDGRAIDFPLLSTFSLLHSLFFNPPFCRDSHQFPMFSMGLHSTPVGMIAKSENTESIDDLLNPTTGSDDENSHGFSIPSEIERMGSSTIHHG
jgi:hypothetical protein